MASNAGPIGIALASHGLISQCLANKRFAAKSSSDSLREKAMNAERMENSGIMRCMKSGGSHYAIYSAIKNTKYKCMVIIYTLQACVCEIIKSTLSMRWIQGALSIPGAAWQEDSPAEPAWWLTCGEVETP